MFIGERAFKDENLFTTGVSMGWKRGSRRIANETGGAAKRLITHEITTLNSWCWRGFPGEILCWYDDEFLYIGA
jgi:hypothetical protein